MTSTSQEGKYFWDQHKYNQLSARISLNLYYIYDIKCLCIIFGHPKLMNVS